VKITLAIVLVSFKGDGPRGGIQLPGSRSCSNLLAVR
jgi:hypothetical protein